VPLANYCPTCRLERDRASGRAARERARQGLTRSLGTLDKCQVCGREYPVEGAGQKFCRACRPEQRRRRNLAQVRQSAEKRRCLKAAKTGAAKANIKVCRICGRFFLSRQPRKTMCSPACAKEQRRARDRVRRSGRAAADAPVA
jgi:hypothetical protein